MSPPIERDPSIAGLRQLRGGLCWTGGGLWGAGGPPGGPPGGPQGGPQGPGEGRRLWTLCLDSTDLAVAYLLACALSATTT